MCTKTEQGSGVELDTKPVIIGELTVEENSTLDKLIKFGLGFALDRRCKIQLKDELLSTSGSYKSVELKDCVVDLVRLKLDGQGPFIVKGNTIGKDTFEKITDPKSSSDEMVVYDPKKYTQNQDDEDTEKQNGSSKHKIVKKK